ncbi:MAG: SBBP repeat-containing protein [Acidobacteria bacterium]|nr:SBBP repeat-containing protein [Acidobacteriota bacterium]
MRRIACALVGIGLTAPIPFPLERVRPHREEPFSGNRIFRGNEGDYLTAAPGLVHFPHGFELNEGQLPAPARFIYRVGESAFLLTDSGSVLTVPGGGCAPDILAATPPSPQTIAQGSSFSHMGMRLAGSNPGTKAAGVGELPGRVNYLIGNNPAHWITQVSTYESVRYDEVYPGVDMVFYGTEGGLEYDFVVAPKADPERIAISLNGDRRPVVDEAGDLVLQTAAGLLRHRKPVAFQMIAGRRLEIGASYVPAERTSYGKNHESVFNIEVGAYDREYPLTIDPVLVYSTYLGGTGGDSGSSIAIDAAGNAYVAGSSSSRDLPITEAYQGKVAGGFDAFVAKLDPSGSQMIFCTYLGGSGTDRCNGLAVDGTGNILLTGMTTSPDFPRARSTQSALAGGYDAWVAKLTPDGTALVYATYLGGAARDQGTAIVTDPSGNTYVAGTTLSDNFPTARPVQHARAGQTDLFLASYKPLGTTLDFSTYWGGSADDVATAIAADAAGNVYITGFTRSWDLPLAAPIQPATGGAADAIVMKFSVRNRAIIYATYLGGSADEAGRSIALDAAGRALITGETYSSNFPIQNALQPSMSGPSDIFISKLDETGHALIYSTYLGGGASENLLGGGAGIALGRNGHVYITGSTSSPGFPLVNPVQPAYGGGETDAFVAELSSDGRSVVFSSFLGGSGNENQMGGGSAIALDPEGRIYVVGFTTSVNFPVQNALQASNRGAFNLFVAKFAP